jgi:FKBP-type peptidyl-prolyl cis-trans isomerase FklB
MKRTNLKFMKIRFTWFFIVVVILGSTISCNKKAVPLKTAPVGMVNNLDSVSYAIGSLFGTSLHSAGFDTLNISQFTKAIEAAMHSKLDTSFTVEKANGLVQVAVQNKQKIKNEKTLAEGKDFLAKNKKEAGVVELPSGLQYKVIKDGEGESPKADSKITAHYKGSLLNGQVFDSSYDRGEPAQFGVSDVIDGWKEALQLMKPGAKWMLYVPSNLAYGENAMQGSPIPPNSVLIFEVELLSIDKDVPVQDSNN